MTLTSRAMDWLNQNRMRSYPVIRDEWRRSVSPESRLDCILLDALLYDQDASGDERLSFESASVSASKTVIAMKYGSAAFSLELSGGDVSGDGSFVRRCGTVRGSGGRSASLSLALSSHAYILDAVGEGSWTFGCGIIPSRVIRVSDGYGVDSIATNGSLGVDGHDNAALASGDVVLEDGYRTSPIIKNGGVLVRVGRNYGLNPCNYSGFGESDQRDCRTPLFFFCGQNAINGGNVVIKGGRGISVSQGRKYKVRDKKSVCYGKTIPCIEIVAGRELLDIYNPGRQNDII